MKTYIFIIGVILALFIPQSGRCQTPHGREHLSLNGVWRYLPEDVASISEKDLAAKPAAGAKEISIPGQRGSNLSGSVWYWRETTLPDGWTKLNVRLRIEGVEGAAEAWTNGRKCEMESADNKTFTFDITKQLAPATSNMIAVRISPPTGAKSNSSAANTPPIGEINLIASDEAHIESIDIDSKTPGWVAVKVRIVNTSDKSGDAQLQAEIFEISQPKKRLSSSAINVVISPGRNRAEMSIKLRPPKRIEGQPEPTYRATVTFRQLKDILDNDTVSFTLPAPQK